MAQKVLLIDDDTYIRDVYKEILEDAGFEVTTAFDGEQGLHKILEGGTFDLILLDVMMPKLDGLGVLKALKEKGFKKGQEKIILLTNLGHDPIINEALENGADSFLIKSDLNPDQLIENIKKILG